MFSSDSVELRYNEGPRDWKKFVSYNEVSLYRRSFFIYLTISRLKKNSSLYCYIEVR